MGFLSSLSGSLGDNISSGLTGALFGGITAGRNWRYQKKAMSLQQQYNERNMQLQYDYATKAWERENRYNNPSASAARWRLAGISPAAVYGNSPGGAGVAGSMSTPDSSNPAGSGNVDNSTYRPVSTVADYARLENERKVADSQADLNNALADKARGDTKDPDETKRGQKLYNDGLDLTNKLTASKVINQGTQNELDALDLRMKNELFDTTVKIEKQKAENLAKQYEQMNQQIAESAARENLANAQVKEVVSRIALNAAYAYLANTQAQWHGRVSQAQINEFVAKATNLDELTKVAKADSRLTTARAVLEEQNAKVFDSNAGEFVKEVGAIISSLSPFKINFNVK